MSSRLRSGSSAHLVPGSVTLSLYSRELHLIDLLTWNKIRGESSAPVLQLRDLLLSSCCEKVPLNL